MVRGITEQGIAVTQKNPTAWRVFIQEFVPLWQYFWLLVLYVQGDIYRRLAFRRNI